MKKRIFGMSRGYGHGGSGSLEASLASLAIVLALVVLALALLLFVMLVRSIVYVCQTFNRYGSESKGLQKSLRLFLVALVLAGLLFAIFSALNQLSIAYAMIVLPAIGYTQLLICCRVVQLNFSQTFLKQGYSVVDDVLRKDWWSSYPDTAAVAA